MPQERQVLKSFRWSLCMSSRFSPKLQITTTETLLEERNGAATDWFFFLKMWSDTRCSCCKSIYCCTLVMLYKWLQAQKVAECKLSLDFFTCWEIIVAILFECKEHISFKNATVSPRMTHRGRLKHNINALHTTPTIHSLARNDIFPSLQPMRCQSQECNSSSVKSTRDDVLICCEHDV